MAKSTESVMHQHRIERLTSDAADDGADIANTYRSRRQRCFNSSESIFIESNMRQPPHHQRDRQHRRRQEQQHQQQPHHQYQYHHHQQQRRQQQKSNLYGYQQNPVNKLRRITTTTLPLLNVMSKTKPTQIYSKHISRKNLNEHRNDNTASSHRMTFSSRQCIFSRFSIVFTLILVFLIEKITCDQGKQTDKLISFPFSTFVPSFATFYPFPFAGHSRDVASESRDTGRRRRWSAN